MGLTHFELAPRVPISVGHFDTHWTLLGEAAGCHSVGLRRIEVAEGSWTTPAHEHGREEEVFYVLSGRGIAWLDGETAPVAAGDCIVYRPRRGAHSVHALEPLDVLAFGMREHDENPRFPRLGATLVGARLVHGAAGSVARLPVQFVEEAKLGPPELPPTPGGRPDTIINLCDVEARTVERGSIARTRRQIARAAGSTATGLQHVQVAPAKESAPLHCHSLEEEIFVVLEGDGVLVLEGREESGETPLRPGSVVGRPAGSGVAHQFRAGERGLSYLAFGPRLAGDICYYPRSNKINFGGVGVIARVERLDYWDGEG